MKGKKIDWKTCGRCGSRKTMVSCLPYCEKCGETAFSGSWDGRPREWGRIVTMDTEGRQFVFRQPRSNDELDFG